MFDSARIVMNSWCLENLPWLPVAPDDFSARCEEAITLPHPLQVRAFRALVNHSLDINQLTRLARRWRKVCENGVDHHLTPFRLGLVSNATVGLLIPCLEASALRYGINLEVIPAHFGQTMQAALDPASSVFKSKPDAILLAIDHRGLPFAPRFAAGFDVDGADPVQESLNHLDLIGTTFRKNGCSAVIMQTLAQPPEALFGSCDPCIPNTWRFRIDSFNQALAQQVHGSPNVLLDVAGLAAAVGLHQWHDPGAWNQARLAFSQRCVPLYADHVARLIAALRGKNRKCLVLDLDNTLWGGVIGEDGLGGIALGEGDPLGEAHLSVQHMALDLRSRGIVLAVCSKNDEHMALLPFREHPDMCLRQDQIAVFMANWHDKASNLTAIAQTLNIGIDSLVFVDDNPIEREQVRQALPEVAVPELPADPAWYARTVLAAGYFEAVAFTAEDRQRADHYQKNAARSKHQDQYHDLEGFLTSLKMQAYMAPFNAVGRPRIAQLINKTNQFNLTTKRYTDAQVAAMEQNPALFTLQIRLTDRFGDNGIISIVIINKKINEWYIDTWLMSCRVINRRVEEAVFAQIIAAARQADVTTLIGEYTATDRNDLVKNHYKKLGFVCIAENAGTSIWSFTIADYLPVPLPVAIADNP